MLKEISIEIIRKCPNHCLHCSSLSDEKCTEIMRYDKFVAIVRDAAALGAQTICLSGGEPFLHDRVTDMIAFVSSLGLQTYVYTSGITFDENNQKAPINRDVLKIVSSHINKLIFNIEAATQSTYDMVMGTVNCFDKMKQSICYANSFGIRTEAHFVPMKVNFNEVMAVLNLCRELNIAKLSFLRLVLHGRAQINETQIALTEEDVVRLRTFLHELTAQSQLDIRIGVPLTTDISCHKCEAANGKLNIKYDGKVFPCEVFKNDRVSQCLKGTQPDSVYDKSLLDIYNQSAYLNLVRGLSEKFSSDNNVETCVGQHLISTEGSVCK